MEKIAVFVALTLSVLITVLGAVSLVYPQALVGIIRVLHAPSALYVDAGVRIDFGAALFFAAPTSRAPTILRALGVLVLASGLAMPALGADGFRSLVEWKLAPGSGFNRVWAVSAVVSGALLAYALVPKSRAA